MPMIEKTDREWRLQHPHAAPYLAISFYTDADWKLWQPVLERIDQLVQQMAKEAPPKE